MASKIQGDITRALFHCLTYINYHAPSNGSAAQILNRSDHAFSITKVAPLERIGSSRKRSNDIVSLGGHGINWETRGSN
ncbi:hypothetical protein K439DRAFT_1158646 [Ramaria rubella]|nr:hypothetical protein K439DRAFT_1158646 [Ramaria rubella]